MTGDENKEVCMNTQHPSDSGNVELLKPSSVEETVGEDIKVENNKGEHEGVNNIMEGEDQMEVDDGIKVESNTEEQEGMDDKVEGKDHMEVDEGSNKDNTDEDVGEGKGTDDEEQNVKEVEDGKAGGEEVDGKIGDETSSGPLKDVSNDDIPVSVIRENSNTESHEKIHVTRSSTRVKNASHSEAKTVKASTLNEGDSKVDAPMPDQSLGNGVVVDEKVAVKAKGGLEEEGSTGQHAVSLDGQTGEEAFDGSLKDVSNDEVPASVVGENSNTELHEKVHVTRSSKRVKDAAHSEANTVKTSTLNEGDSQVDAPVPDQLLGNGVEVDEKVAFKAKGGLEEEGSAGQHAVSLDGQLGEEASGAPLKDILNDNIPVDEVRKNSNIVIQEKVHATRNSKRVKDAAHLEANSVKASNQNNGLSLVDAPVPDLPLGDGAEVNEKFPVEAKGGLEEEGPIGEHCVSLDGPNNVENAFVPCTNNGPAGPSTPILCKVNDEVNSMENVKEFPMSVDNTEQIQNMYSDFESLEGGESGTEEEQSSFIKELERVFKELSLEFKAPRFYGEPLNLLKLWRAVIKLGGYDKVTALKLWRQVGESFKPPKTCTTVSWTFRQFYEKALLDYERHKVRGGTLDVPTPPTVPMSTEGHAGSNQTPGSGSGRMRRDAAARAMQGWHSQRLLNNGEVSDPIIKDKSAVPLKNREKHLKTTGLPKRKRPLVGDTPKALHPPKMIKRQSDNTTIIDAGPPADWVKVNVKTTKDCYEVYALVPGLLREEVLVQTDPAGRLVITGEPENADNPWGVTPFKKVVTLPSRIDPHQTSAVVTLHGQLFVRVPFEQSD